jgi:hypothetical protein
MKLVLLLLCASLTAAPVPKSRDIEEREKYAKIRADYDALLEELKVTGGSQELLLKMLLAQVMVEDVIRIDALLRGPLSTAERKQLERDRGFSLSIFAEDPVGEELMRLYSFELRQPKR